MSTNSFKGNVEQVVNGTHPIVKDTKADFKGLANSAAGEVPEDSDQPLSHFHSLFYDLFTWKFPKATGFFFAASLSVIFAFHYVNVLRYVFKAAYMTFAATAAVEVLGKPLGLKGVVSSLRPKRYWTIPRGTMEGIFDSLHGLSNFFVLELQRVVFVENIFATIAAFFASFFGYFLIKYIPLWALIVLTDITAFSAPLIYLQNKDVIDAQVTRASDLVNEKLHTGRKLADKYAGDAAAAAKAKATELSNTVQSYAARKSPPSSPNLNKKTHDALSGAPNAPTAEPRTGYQQNVRQPILA